MHYAPCTTTSHPVHPSRIIGCIWRSSHHRQWWLLLNHYPSGIDFQSGSSLVQALIAMEPRLSRHVKKLFSCGGPKSSPLGNCTQRRPPSRLRRQLPLTHHFTSPSYCPGCQRTNELTREVRDVICQHAMISKMGRLCRSAITRCTPCEPPGHVTAVAHDRLYTIYHKLATLRVRRANVTALQLFTAASTLKGRGHTQWVCC